MTNHFYVYIDYKNILEVKNTFVSERNHLLIVQNLKFNWNKQLMLFYLIKDYLRVNFWNEFQLNKVNENIPFFKILNKIHRV